VLYLLPLAIQPEHDPGSSGYRVTIDHLSHVINPVEAKLGSHVTINPALHFLVYIPLQEHSPLHIYTEGKPSESNSVLIPGWGGLMVYNPQLGTNYTSINMAAVMSRFISQLRSLLVLEDKELTSTVLISPLDNRSIHDWEVDCLLRKRTVQNLVVTSSTLQSLSLLLTEISNIVISDEVARQVSLSVSALENSHLYLESGDLQQAYSHSRLAYIAAEKAFFDPSMLALLYFPDGQKYAIYIPLFLPVGIPVLQSLPVLWRWMSHKLRTPHTKTD
jgi:phosphatidylinositol glycan class S